MMLSVNGNVVGVSSAHAEVMRSQGWLGRFDDPIGSARALLSGLKGPLRVGIPFPHSMHRLLFEYWLNAASGNAPSAVELSPNASASAPTAVALESSASAFAPTAVESSPFASAAVPNAVPRSPSALAFSPQARASVPVAVAPSVMPGSSSQTSCALADDVGIVSAAKEVAVAITKADAPRFNSRSVLVAIVFFPLMGRVIRAKDDGNCSVSII